MPSERQELETAAIQFCQAFASGRDADHILSLFSSTHPISTIEHGEPELAPFLGRMFEGREGVKQYLHELDALLTHEHLTFSDYVIDPVVKKVALKGQGTFRWLKTQESWKETFAYVLDFDDEMKVIRYQIWADSGAAYLARVGQLSELREMSR